MSVKDYCKKIAYKGDVEPTPHVIRCNDLIVSCDIEIWKLNLIEAIQEALEEEHGCSVWFSYMKD